MENKIAELKKIKEALEVLINESEKPRFELNKWYKYENKPASWWLGYIKDDFTYYGFNENNWFDCSGFKLTDTNDNHYNLATQKEVEEALTKEAVKRGFKIGTKYYSAMWDDKTIGDSTSLNWRFKQETNTLYMNNNNGIVFHNGKWAEIIKTKTIDELVNDLYECTRFDLANYLTENKQTIIETINNL